MAIPGVPFNDARRPHVPEWSADADQGCKEVEALLQRFTSAWDATAIRGKGPDILKRAAVRTIVLALVAFFVMAAFAAAV